VRRQGHRSGFEIPPDSKIRNPEERLDNRSPRCDEYARVANRRPSLSWISGENGASFTVHSSRCLSANGLWKYSALPHNAASSFLLSGGLFTSLTKMSSRWIQAEHMGDLRHSKCPLFSKDLPGALAQTTLHLVTQLTIPSLRQREQSSARAFNSRETLREEMNKNMIIRRSS